MFYAFMLCFDYRDMFLEGYVQKGFISFVASVIQAYITAR